MVLIDHGDHSDAELYSGNLIFLVIGEEYLLIAHTLIGQRFRMQVPIELIHIRYFGGFGKF